jgi:hypothetical protein
MCALYKEQAGFLNNIPALITTLQQLPALEGFALSWGDNDDERFSGTYKRCTENDDRCFRKVLFAISRTIMLRATKKNPITSF